ncbi:MAG: electron transfer flavoprotein subunit alpha/FixB family protein [Deltaproteobacteria bacterium]|nr:electron transfer flavoprotein subunit alpha/FixB family protein [Deltaproteobacteria bacterium]
MTSKRVVVCSWSDGQGTIAVGSEEALSLGRKVAGALGSELHWLVLGPQPEGLLETAGRFGVASVDRIENAALEAFAQDAYVEALAQYCNQESPALVLFSQAPDTRLVAPRLAGRLGAGVVMNVVDVTAGDDGGLEATASAYGGDTRMVYELSGAPAYVVALNTTALLAEPAEAGPTSPECRTVAVDLSGTQERIRVIERPRAEGPRLEEADIIVSGGRGLGSPENYKLIEQLAEAVGGLAGASRPIVDEGWVDSSRQVGLTGKITRPALYLAAGISGASQHMAGCSAAKTIVAINRDPDASIFRYCRYGLVGDCLEILPELIRAAKQ